MYSVTFYSFKGGVGRSMALVNVGVALAQAGRRVLLVDFDLEAPGLDTFDLPGPGPNAPRLGLVDYVAEYKATREAPNASRFIYQCPGVGSKPGGLWIMPSGTSDESYVTKLYDIDWLHLYEEHDGFLMFEDLRQQWRQIIDPDYVLVDSRTGHTDIGGICTRHLPDAVVVLFAPNEQHLRGLRRVVKEIRDEATGPRRKHIDLQFVLSNVPDLDDEERILEARIAEFRDLLGFDRYLQIHRYDSLLLLVQQAVFTKQRPNSRLAREYVEVLNAIAERNPRDRTSVVARLQGLQSSFIPGRRGPEDSLEPYLEQVELEHGSDGEVLFNLGMIRWQERRTEDALAFFDRAIAHSYQSPEVFLARARARAESNDRDGSAEDAAMVFDFSGVRSRQLLAALRLLKPEAMEEAAASPAMKHLRPSDQIEIARTLTRSDEELQAAHAILGRLLSEGRLKPTERAEAAGQLAAMHLGLGLPGEALEQLTDEVLRPSLDTLPNLLHLAMAEWGHEKAVPTERLRRVRETIGALPPAERTAQLLQAAAIAAAAVGESGDAATLINEASNEASARRGLVFSFWRYRLVRVDDFLRDLDEISQFSAEREPLPPFMREAAHA